MRPYSIYMAVVEGYSTTVITLETLLRPGLNFTKFIIIAAGTQDSRLLQLFADITDKGYQDYPADKFHIIAQSLEESMGAEEALNYAMTLTAGDLFYSSNNCWFGPQTISTLLIAAQDTAATMLALCPVNVMSLWSNIRENYDSRVRQYLIDQDQKGPKHYRQAIQDFFYAHGPLPDHDVDTTLKLLADKQPAVQPDESGDTGIYFKRECFTTIGFFDERFSRTATGKPCGGGEFDYADRVRAAGYTFAKVPQALALHMIYGQTSKTGYRGELEAERRQRYFDKVAAGDAQVWYKGQALPALHNIEDYT